MRISNDKTFPWVPTFFTLCLRIWFTVWKNWPCFNTFSTRSARALIFQMSIYCHKIFLLVSRYLSLWPWPSLELAFFKDFLSLRIFVSRIQSLTSNMQVKSSITAVLNILHFTNLIKLQTFFLRSQVTHKCYWALHGNQ